MSNVYRARPTIEPESRRSWLCRVGLHEWRGVGYRVFGQRRCVCTRPGCGARTIRPRRPRPARALRRIWIGVEPPG